MTSNDKRTLAVRYMTDRAGKNAYTQGSKREYFFGYPDNDPANTQQKGYSDCSSAVRCAIQKASGLDIGSNTSSQINNRTKKGKIVHETDGFYPDESKLKIGDCLYFKGNTSHPLSVGHVEMYIGDGKLCGHGSGTGPQIKSIESYCKSRATSKRRYFMAVRWIQDDSEDEGYTRRKNLKKGMYGEDVRELQEALLALNYSLGKYGADGEFGSATKSALNAFQRDNGLLETGIANDETWRKIDALLDNQNDADDDNTPDEDEATVTEPEGDSITVASGTWNLRTGPSSSFPAAKIVRGGDRLQKIDLDGWTPVLVNGEVLFIGPKGVQK